MALFNLYYYLSFCAVFAVIVAARKAWIAIILYSWWDGHGSRGPGMYLIDQLFLFQI